MFSRINNLFVICITLFTFVGVSQAIADPETNKAVSRRDFDEI